MNLTDNEKELIELYRTLTKKDKDSAFRMVKLFADHRELKRKRVEYDNFQPPMEKKE